MLRKMSDKIAEGYLDSANKIGAGAVAALAVLCCFSIASIGGIVTATWTLSEIASQVESNEEQLRELRSKVVEIKETRFSDQDGRDLRQDMRELFSAEKEVTRLQNIQIAELTEMMRDVLRAKSD